MPLLKLLKEGSDYNFPPTLINNMKEKGGNIEQLDIENHVGSGMFSEAYKINNSFVVKISRTMDTDPWKILIGKDIPHVAKIFDVIEYKSYSLIFQQYIPFPNNIDYIIKNPRNLKNEFEDEELGMALSQFGRDNNIKYDYDASSMASKFVDICINNEVVKEDNRSGLYTFTEHFIIGLNGLKEYLKEYQFEDVHIENVRQDQNNNYIIIDF